MGNLLFNFYDFHLPLTFIEDWPDPFRRQQAIRIVPWTCCLFIFINYTSRKYRILREKCLLSKG